jgi:ADP-ribosylglycohydrolase
MRSAIIGAYFAEDAARRREFAVASSRLTHRGWQAEVAALAVTEAAALARVHPGVPDATRVLAALARICEEREWQQCLSKIESCLRRNDSVAEFARGHGLERGVSGYSLHVVPVALFAWLRHEGDFRCALTAALDCGGDTDTVGATLGALCGASAGPESIPGEWIDSLAERPRSVTFIRALGQRLADQKEAGQSLGELHYFWPALIPRNLLFIVVILAHGFRRLLPPY